MRTFRCSAARRYLRREKQPLVNPEPQIEPAAAAYDAAVPGLSLKGRVARSIFWIAWSRGVVQVLQFASTLVVAHILVPADYGVTALAGVCTGTARMLAEMGLGNAIIQFRDLDRREIDTCFWIAITLATIAFAVLALAAAPIARWFVTPRLAYVLPVTALLLPLTACSIVSDSLLRKRLALDRVSQAEIIGMGASLPVTLGCAFAGLGVWALVAGWLVATVGRNIATFAFAPWRPGWRVGGRRAKEMLHFSLATLGVEALWALREQTDSLVIGKVTGQVTLGLYSMAKDLAMLPLNKISPVINMLSMPMMAELQTDINAMRAELYRGIRLIAAIVIPTSIGMALVADQMVAALLGPKWLPAIPIMRLLSVYAATRAIEPLLTPVLFARRRQQLLFWYFLAQLLVVPAATVVGALWDGASGAVMLLIPVLAAFIAILAKAVLAEVKGKFSQLWLQAWPVLAATAAMVVVVLLVRAFVLAGRAEPPFVGLILLSVSGAITYGAALFAIGSPVIDEAAEVVRWILGRYRVHLPIHNADNSR